MRALGRVQTRNESIAPVRVPGFFFYDQTDDLVHKPIRGRYAGLPPNYLHKHKRERCRSSVTWQKNALTRMVMVTAMRTSMMALPATQILQWHMSVSIAPPALDVVRLTAISVTHSLVAKSSRTVSEPLTYSPASSSQ